MITENQAEQTVLVYSDFSTTRRVVTRILERIGITNINLTGTLQEAQDAIHEQCYQVIIIYPCDYDWGNFFKFVSRIVEFCPNSRFIAVVSEALQETRKELLSITNSILFWDVPLGEGNLIRLLEKEIETSVNSGNSTEND